MHQRDTHPVSATFGGTNTGLLVSSDASNEDCLSICKLMWKVLYDIKEENTQSLSALVLDNKMR